MRNNKPQSCQKERYVANDRDVAFHEFWNAQFEQREGESEHELELVRQTDCIDTHFAVMRECVDSNNFIGALEKLEEMKQLGVTDISYNHWKDTIKERKVIYDHDVAFHEFCNAQFEQREGGGESEHELELVQQTHCIDADFAVMQECVDSNNFTGALEKLEEMKQKLGVTVISYNDWKDTILNRKRRHLLLEAFQTRNFDYVKDMLKHKYGTFELFENLLWFLDELSSTGTKWPQHDKLKKLWNETVEKDSNELNELQAKAAVFVVDEINNKFTDARMKKATHDLCAAIMNKLLELNPIMNNEDEYYSRKLRYAVRNALWLSDNPHIMYKILQVREIPDFEFSQSEYNKKFGMTEPISDAELPLKLPVFDGSAAAKAAAHCTDKEGCGCKNHKEIFSFLMLICIIGQMKVVASQKNKILRESIVKTIRYAFEMCSGKLKSGANIEPILESLFNRASQPIPDYLQDIKHQNAENNSETFHIKLLFLCGLEVPVHLPKELQLTMADVVELFERKTGIDLTSSVYHPDFNDNPDFNDKPVPTDATINENYDGDIFTVIFTTGPSNFVVMLVAIVVLSVDSFKRMYEKEKLNDRENICPGDPSYCELCQGACVFTYSYPENSDAMVGFRHKVLSLSTIFQLLADLANNQEAHELKLDIQACKKNRLVFRGPKEYLHTVRVKKFIGTAVLHSDHLVSESLTADQLRNGREQATARLNSEFANLGTEWQQTEVETTSPKRGTARK